MECNRDEAVRAKEIAERKFLAKDYKGARKFALKAQNLYPELEGISQMVTTVEIYISAEEEKINGESNWYSILGLTPLADEETIRKQYRKLALLLHPDKNRSVGAEGAFKFVSKAWGMLSDKTKRKAYDQRNQTVNRGPSPPAKQNGFYNIAKTAAASQVKVPKGNSGKRDSSSGPYPPRKKERHTFWTVCHRCKMQYEYLRMYLNHHLLCPNCHEAYYAVEIEPPASNKVSKTPPSQYTGQPGASSTSRYNHGKESNSHWTPFSDSTGGKSAFQAASMVQQAYEKVKRERQKAQAATRKEEALRRKNHSSKRTSGAELSGKRRKVDEDFRTGKEMTNSESQTVCGSVSKQNNSLGSMSKNDGVFPVDIKQLLMEKARKEIRNKINENIPSVMVTNEEVHENIKETEEKDSIVTNDVRNNRNELYEDVPEPEFHNFDDERTEKSFSDNQVWAVYDDDDAMPRHYAMIHNVISLNPFKVRLSWLTNSTLGHVNWYKSNFSKTCGEFGIGRVKICNSIDFFSHKVKFTKSESKTIRILPRKGDVWALYRNWSPYWDELTEEEVIHKYDMVEILEDYDEELGVIVVPLVKVAGFKSVFRQHFDPNEIRRIPKEEMSRFSHQVPSHLLSDAKEEVNYPRGCLELDPAAVPLEILQVVSEIEGFEFVESDEEIEFVKAVDPNGNVMVEAIS